jgi:hypothetical protein
VSTNFGCDPFLLWVLEAIVAGRERCGGCGRQFNDTSEAALIGIWYARDASDLNASAYCLRCVERHADDIADACVAHNGRHS